MKIFESLTDAIKHAAENYTEENSNKIIVTSPKQFNVQSFVDEKTDEEYWVAEFLEKEGVKGNFEPLFRNEKASDVFTKIINGKFTEKDSLKIAVDEIFQDWERKEPFFNKEESKYEIIKS